MVVTDRFHCIYRGMGHYIGRSNSVPFLSVWSIIVYPTFCIMSHNFYTRLCFSLNFGLYVIIIRWLYIIMWFIYFYYPGLLCWYWLNHMIPVPVKQHLTHCGLVTTYCDILTWVNIGSAWDFGYLTDCTKPSPEPMLTYDQQCPMAFSGG